MNNQGSIVQRNRERAQEQLKIEHKEYLKHHRMLVDMINNIPLNTYVKLLIEYGKDNFYIIVKITKMKSRSFYYTLFASEKLTMITTSVLNSIKEGVLLERISIRGVEILIKRIHGWEKWSFEDAPLIVGWEYIADHFKNKLFSK